MRLEQKSVRRRWRNKRITNRANILDTAGVLRFRGSFLFVVEWPLCDNIGGDGDPLSDRKQAHDVAYIYALESDCALHHTNDADTVQTMSGFANCTQQRDQLDDVPTENHTKFLKFRTMLAGTSRATE